MFTNKNNVRMIMTINNKENVNDNDDDDDDDDDDENHNIVFEPVRSLACTFGDLAA
jgi:hypothetical protein